MAFLIYEHFRVTGTNESILEITDLMSASLSGETIFKDLMQSGMKFSHLWETLPKMTYCKVCTDKNSGNRNNCRPHLPCTIKILYKKHEPTNYTRLKNKVERFLDQVTKDRNFDARMQLPSDGNQRAEAKGKT